MDLKKCVPVCSVSLQGIHLCSVPFVKPRSHCACSFVPPAFLNDTPTPPHPHTVLQSSAVAQHWHTVTCGGETGEYCGPHTPTQIQGQCLLIQSSNSSFHVKTANKMMSEFRAAGNYHRFNCRLFSWLIGWSIKCQKIVLKISHLIPNNHLSDWLLCPIGSSWILCSCFGLLVLAHCHTAVAYWDTWTEQSRL